MTPSRWITAIGTVAVLSNGGRLLYYAWHGRSAPSVAMLVVLFVLLIGAVAGAVYWSSKDQGRWLPSVFPALASGVLCALLAVGINTYVERTYGWALFVLVPFVIGFHAAVALSYKRAITLGDALVISSLALLLFGGVLLAVAVEGAICLMMAAPLALPVALLGGALGYAMRHQPAVRNPALFLLLAGLTPFGGTAEHAFHLRAELYPVTTSIDLPDSPERVWRTVLQPAKLGPPHDPRAQAWRIRLHRILKAPDQPPRAIATSPQASWSSRF